MVQSMAPSALFAAVKHAADMFSGQVAQPVPGGGLGGRGWGRRGEGVRAQVGEGAVRVMTRLREWRWTSSAC